MLRGKNIVVGVTGCIAAYKTCDIVSRLKKLGANVDVIMTAHATEFVQPLSFETLSGRRVISDMFSRDFEWEVEHVSLAKKADLFLVAPATANSVAKFANGIADDMLSTTWLACKAHKVVCPAMNTNMLEDEQTQKNISLLASRGVHVVESISGRLACGDTGRGKMAEPADIVAEVEKILTPKPDFCGKTVLVTAGATAEPIDAVRFVTNRSSGKMGVALACAAADRGADVIFVGGKMSVALPTCTKENLSVSTTQEMRDAVVSRLPEADVIIMAAAPADYRVDEVSSQKIKSADLTLHFVKNPDIAAEVGKCKGDKILVIFCAETENLLENARKKLASKNADMVVANDVTKKGAGFDVDTNIVSIATNDSVESFDILSKSDLAHVILDKVSVL